MSLDAGMENVKSIIDGRKNVSQIAIAEVPVYGVLDGESEDESIFEYCGVRYYIGNTYAKNNAISVRNFVQYAKLMPLLILKELLSVGVVPDKRNRIVIKSFRTGIPLSQYSKKQVLIDILKPAFKGIMVNGIEIWIEELRIGVQGLVAPTVFFGRHIPKGYIVVVEIGSKTTEVMTIENGKIVNDVNYSKSIERGMSNAYLQLLPFLQKEFGQEFTEAQAAEAFRRKFIESKGKKYDISKPVDAVTQQYARKLVDELEITFSKAFNEAKHILVCGGGAYNDILIAELNQRFSNILTLPEDCEYVNAKGYDLV